MSEHFLGHIESQRMPHTVGGFSIHHGQVDRNHLVRIADSITNKAHIYNVPGRSHRRYFPFKNFKDTVIFTNGAYACLAGVTITSKGLYAFHDLPGKIASSRIQLPNAQVYGTIMGGGYNYWKVCGDLYEKDLGKLQYLPQPDESENYSFTYFVDLAHRDIYCGYYFQDRGYSYGGPGWNYD